MIKIPKRLFQSHMITELTKVQIQMEEKFKNDCINSGVCDRRYALILIDMVNEASKVSPHGFVNILETVEYILFEQNMPPYAARAYLKSIIRGTENE